MRHQVVHIGLEEWVGRQLGWHLEIVRRTIPKEHSEQLWATARKRQRAGATVVEMWAGLSIPLPIARRIKPQTAKRATR